MLSRWNFIIQNFAWRIFFNIWSQHYEQVKFLEIGNIPNFYDFHLHMLSGWNSKKLGIQKIRYVQSGLIKCLQFLSLTQVSELNYGSNSFWVYLLQKDCINFTVLPDLYPISRNYTFLPSASGKNRNWVHCHVMSNYPMKFTETGY